MLSSYFAVNRRAVLNYFNPFKTEQFIVDYISTIQSLHNHDLHSRKCLRSIYFVLLFQFIFQLYLHLFPFPWHRLIFFDILDESNNYPALFKLNVSATFLMCAYMFHMLYVRIASERCFQLFYEYNLYDTKTFVKTPCWGIKKLAVSFLNVYQIFPMVSVMYMCFEYITFTLRIFRGHSLLVWTQWIEFVCMNIFFVALASAIFLIIYIFYTCITCAILGVAFLVFRFRETYEPLSRPYSRFTTLRLLRFAHRNIGTMQNIFSLNRLYGPILLAFLMVNLPSNLMIAILSLQNRLSSGQTLVMLCAYLGQLTCFLGVHLVAAAFSKKIHSPYKRIMSLNILIQQCPLHARIHLANAIQTFNVKNNKYGITYGCGKWAVGLVTMMSFTKFILLYGELLMSQYNNLK